MLYLASKIFIDVSRLSTMFLYIYSVYLIFIYADKNKFYSLESNGAHELHSCKRQFKPVAFLTPPN